MENMLTVEEVAKVLRVKPFTVRQMFREGRLRGFKVGKAWRTTESTLEQDIFHMRGVDAPIEAAVEIEEESPPSPSQIEPPSPRLDLDTSALGQLLVFSDIPGQDVILDGERRGVTTLAVSNLAAGTHEMKVGQAKGPVEIFTDFQTRVRASEGKLIVLSQPKVIEHDETGAEVRDFLIRIFFKREIDFVGSLQIDLRSGGTPDKGKTDRKIAEDDPAAQTITSSIAEEDMTTLFDGVIRGKVGDPLNIRVPAQPGLPSEAEKTVVLDTDLDITLTLALAGRFRAKPTVSFGVEPKM